MSSRASHVIEFFVRRILRIAALAVALDVSCAAQPEESTITVRADGDSKPASQDLYGIFVEDWCHQIEGGIYGEMIRNRSFDDTKSAREVLVAGFAMQLPEANDPAAGMDVPGWKLQTAVEGGAAMSIDPASPLNENNPRSLRIEVRTAAPGTGIFNEGFCNNVQGIAVKAGSEYKLSLFARSDAPSAGLDVSIRTPDGKTLAAQKIGGLGKDWKKYEAVLKPEKSFTGARLFISPTAPGTYHLDMVSLFPAQTWKNRPNGLRPDLMELVTAMKPAFVRFPGGCFVEGLEPENAWHWKKTLGPIEERPGHWNIWGWRYSGGMGYHEFLQMCEDLGAEPMHVVFAGISHTAKDGVQQDGVYTYVPMDKMGEVVQDALDSIEYANGTATSKWGALRAANGHPEPFKLKYVEIGNENFGPEYAERYALIYDAIKAKYPDVTIVTNSWGPTNYPKNRPLEVLDIHRFTTPFQFALNYNQFDNYDRKGPKIYFGEWCVELELPDKESLETGLYEGIFLTGLEKNSDIVSMMSYAPFMNNLGWQNRKPNMIGFDLDRVYGAPIYWIQRMYAENPVSRLLPFEVESPEFRPQKIGSIGVGSLNTEAEFKDILVTAPDGKVLFDGNSAAPGDWLNFGRKDKKGERPEAGVIVPGGEGGRKVLTKQAFDGDYTLTLKARKLAGRNGFHIYFDTYFNSNNFWQVAGDGNRSSKIVGEGFVKTDIPKFSVEEGRWYDLKLEKRGDRIRCSVDGEAVNETTYKPLQSLYASAGVDSKGAIILKVINPGGRARQTRIRLPGADTSGDGEAIILTAADPKAKNSLENPDHVVPRKLTLAGLSNDFKHEFPAYSATVLKISPGKPKTQSKP
jgi:alpha-L-arabinofuranosidase